MNLERKINLQLFAEPAAPEPAPAITEPIAAPTQEPVTQLSTSERIKSIWEADNKDDTVNEEPPAQIETPVEPAPAEPVPEVKPAQSEKIMNKYDSVGDLVKAHQSLQTTWNKDRQTLNETLKVVEQLKSEKAEIEAKLQAPAQPTQPIDEFAGLDAESVLEKLYTDPVGVLSKIAEMAVESKVKPLESRLEPIAARNEEQRNLEMWNEAVTEFITGNPDMPEFLDGMKQYVAENDLRNSKEPQKVLKDAYAHAKSATADAKIAEANAKIAELEAKLKTSKEDAVKEHLTGVRQTQNQIPNTIAGHSSTGAPAMPPLSLKGKSMKEVHEAASNFLFGNR